MTFHRTFLGAALAVATLVLPACATGAPVPDRPADVDGRVTLDGARPTLTEASDAYYEGMSLLSAGTSVVDADGARLEADGLRDGDAVEVWAETCAESFPVQCDVVAVRVTG